MIAVLAPHAGAHRAPRKPRPQVFRRTVSVLRKTVAALTAGARAAATPSLLHDEVFWGRPVNGRSLGTLPRRKPMPKQPWETQDCPALPPETTPEQRAEWFRSGAVFNETCELNVEPGLAKAEVMS